MNFMLFSLHLQLSSLHLVEKRLVEVKADVLRSLKNPVVAIPAITLLFVTMSSAPPGCFVNEKLSLYPTSEQQINECSMGKHF